VSTLEHEVMDADVARPSTSMALVPLAVDRQAVGSAALPRAAHASAHRAFYAMGYTGLAMLLVGAWMSAYGQEYMVMMFLPGGFCIGLGGLGVLGHLLWKPRTMHKLRTTLGAIASLGLTIAAMPVIGRISGEVHASSAIAGLQPLAEDLARYGRIGEMEVSSVEWVRLNGFTGLDTGPDAVSGRVPGDPYTVTLEDVLRRDGITRDELAAFRGRMLERGVRGVEVRPGYVLLVRNDAADRLLHVRPGQPLPQAVSGIISPANLRTQPLGGGWYLVRSGTW
jgi:hypothetical protein